MRLNIIIPCYNCSKTIEKCLDSIGIHESISVILINDKSKDNTEEVIEEYIKCHPSLSCILINNPVNLGAGETRNVGLQYVDADYFMFADADDHFTDDFYPEIFQYLNKANADCLVFDAWRYVGERKRYFSMFYTKTLFQGLVSTKDALVFVKGCPWGKVYASKLLNCPDLKFASLKVDEDLVFTKRAIMECNSVFYLAKPLYVYQDVPTSLMHTVKHDESNYKTAFLLIADNARAIYKDELEALYALEVVYPTILDRCANGNNTITLRNEANDLNIYSINNRYVSRFDIKHRAILYMIRFKMFSLIKNILKLC